ncbi:MAG: peptidylprolyl isomerase [Ginsengibacter sp.]
MKKLLLVCVFTLLLYFSYGQTLFTYGTHPVSETEFLNAYNKNKTDSGNNPQALRSYLDLYIKFKLKVQAAKDMKLDTLPSLVADLQNFRNQIQDNYLTDQKELTKLDNEAFERSQKDIHAIYYFLPKSNNEDSVKELKESKELAIALKSNKADDEIIAKMNAENSDQVQKSDLGFITVFNLPYKFENIIYGLKPGQRSIPVSSKKGWYIFKNAAERKAVGKITVAQILFAIPEGANQQKDQAKKLADSVYNALENGSDFFALAKKFSDDRTTFMTGGLMPEFGTAKYDYVFENHAFSLKKDGEISKPFETKFGYHIVKRISAAPVPGLKNNETFMYDLKKQVLKDGRAQIAKQKFDKEIIPVIGLKENVVNKENLWMITDSFLLKKENFSAGKVSASTVLFTFNDHQKIKVSDWLLYLKSLNGDFANKNETEYPPLFSQFLNASANANYASRLESFNHDFKAQVNEFEEGNMLFEIMQREVWGKASSDTDGLRKFYNEHKEKYLWSVSAEAIIFSCSDKSVADNCITELKKGWNFKEIVNENPSKIQADSGRFELGQIPVVDRTAFTAGLITLPVINKNDGTAVFAKILKVYSYNQQRNFEDARGLVINDYQNYLEEKWVDQLKKKYPVTINEKIFQSLVKR